MTLKYQIAGVLIMGIFYAIYLGKMIAQKKQGIVTNQIGKDKSDKKRLRIERLMMIASYGIIIAQLISIMWGRSFLRYSGKTAGIVLGLFGDIIFLMAVLTMGSSWRAGVAANDHRKLVNNGIFKLSRNPAFLGFDLVYIGILIMFFNWFLCVFTIFAIVMLHLQILQEERYLIGEFGEEYLAYKKKVCRYMGRKNWKFWLGIVAAACVIGIFVINSLNSKIEALNNMSFKECLEYTTKGNSDSVITVGIYKDGKTEYKVYGENGKEQEQKLHTYEIGSLTKTITAACINRAAIEGRLSLTDTIDKYLKLPKGKKYPTIEELLTHTSGYEGYYLNPQMMWNAVIGDSPFRYVTPGQILKEAGEEELTEASYEWNYSNFGYALLGLVLENVYDDYYVAIINSYLTELGMENSSFTREQGDLGNCWTWEMRDAYAPAGAIHSNIEDMLTYAALQLSDESMQKMHEPLREIGYEDESYDAMNIHIDEIGMAWIIDNQNGFVWHNGGTDYYNSYLGICKESNTAVVILSNLPDDYRIPATILGNKLLLEIQK